MYDGNDIIDEVKLWEATIVRKAEDRWYAKTERRM